MTRITGILRDSGRNPLDATLRVTLDAPFVDASTTPDAYMLPVSKEFAITGGLVDIDLAQSETSGITYFFEVLVLETSVTYFSDAGTEYSGPVVLHTDGHYYAGITHSPTAARVYRVEQQNQRQVAGFHALVPNVFQVEFTSLIQTGISVDTLDSSVRRLAALLTSDEQYVEALRGGPYIQGNYNPSVFYKKGDLVQYAGSAWLYINRSPRAGQTPSDANTEHWLKFGAKGDPGDGIEGQDTAFDPVGWSGAMWVPTANALRNYLVQLAPLFSPTFLGTPKIEASPSTSATDNEIVTAEWTLNQIAAFAQNAVFANNPTAPTQALTDNSERLATTGFVKALLQRYSRVVFRVAANTNGGTATAGIANVRPLNTITNNAGDVINLAANQITLRAGTYIVAINAHHGLGVGANKIVLRNVTAAQNTLISLNSAATVVTLNGQFAISTNSVFEVHSFVTNTTPSTGLGSPANLSGLAEIYTTVEFWRID